MILALLLVGCQAPAPPPAPSPGAPAPPPALAPPAVAPAAPEPAFTSEVAPIGPDLAARMRGVSWHEGCPVPIDDLAHVSVSFHGLDGDAHTGELIVAADVASPVVDAFRHLWDAGFPLQAVRPIHEHGGSDPASMAANNTSAFNCRKATGGAGWSRHSYGRAIDVNPLINPYVRGDRVLPPEGRAYLDRDPAIPGLIVAEGPAHVAFREIGWKWGGVWRSAKDYQHFSESGR